MRILQVIPFFSPQMGGSAQVAYQISRRLGQRGHDVTVVASDYATGESRFEDGPFEVILFPNLIARWGFYVTPGLVRWAREHVSVFDVVHMHTTRTFQNAVVRHFAVRYGVPYVLSAHGTLPVIVERKLAKRIYDLLAGRSLLASASRLLAVSSLEAEQYGRAAGGEDGRVQVIHNGLDLDQFSPLPPRGSLRQKLGIAPEAPVVLFLGRLHRIKGIDLLVEAFAQLRQEVKETILVISGPDEGELDHLRALAGRLGLEESVRFAGPLYGQDKLAAYVDADVIASPGAYEIFGLVPFEALMCGTPAVVGEGSAAGQLMRQAGAGTLVTDGDVATLADSLRRALIDRAATAAQVAAGQAFVRRELDWDAIAGHLEDLYAGVGVHCA